MKSYRILQTLPLVLSLFLFSANVDLQASDGASCESLPEGSGSLEGSDPEDFDCIMCVQRNCRVGGSQCAIESADCHIERSDCVINSTNCGALDRPPCTGKEEPVECCDESTADEDCDGDFDDCMEDVEECEEEVDDNLTECFEDNNCDQYGNHQGSGSF